MTEVLFGVNENTDEEERAEQPKRMKNIVEAVRSKRKVRTRKFKMYKNTYFRYSSDGEKYKKASKHVSNQGSLRKVGKVSEPRQ